MVRFTRSRGFFLAVVLVAGSFSVAWALVHREAGAVDRSEQGVADNSTSSSSAGTVEDLFADALGGLGSERESIGQEGTVNGEGADRGAQQLPVPDAKWEVAPRTDKDLARMFLTGNYVTDDLVRHVVLNPMDKGLDPGCYRALDDLVSRVRSFTRRFREQVEKDALVDREVVVRSNPIAVPCVSATPVESERRVRAIVENAKARGEDISDEEARGRLARGEAFSVQLPRNSSFIDGKVYRNSDFGPLSKLEASFELVQYVAEEEASIVTGWFCLQGYCTFSMDLADVFERIRRASAKDFYQ